MKRRRQKTTVQPGHFQNYLQSLALASCEAGPDGDSALRERELFRSFAELQYRLNGGGHCGVCGAHVRYKVRVLSSRADGTEMSFDCLCTRCVEAERVLAKRVQLVLGQLKMEYAGTGEAKSNPKPKARAWHAGS